MHAILFLAALGLAAPALATVADDLCPPATDPCEVSSAVSIDPGSTLDFTGRTLRLLPGAKVEWSGDVTIIAAACDFQASTSVREGSVTPGSHFLNLDCDASTLAGSIKTLGAGIIVDGPGPHVLSGKIQAKGDQVGVIAVDSSGLPGDITLTGSIQAQAKAGTPPGEFRLWSTFGNVVVGEKAKVKLQGTERDLTGQYLFLEADSGTLTMDGSIDARIKNAVDGAYHLNFEAQGNVVFGPKSKVSSAAVGYGSTVAINSQGGSVTLRGKITAKAKAVDGSHGGRVHVCAADDILVDGKASIDTSSGGFAGSIVLGAGDVARVGTVSIGAKLTSKTDGDIEVCGGTSGSISQSSKVVPDAESVGSGICLSPTSQVPFFLDCNQ